jgi:hypothetical protein
MLLYIVMPNFAIHLMDMCLVLYNFIVYGLFSSAVAKWNYIVLGVRVINELERMWKV